MKSFKFPGGELHVQLGEQNYQVIDNVRFRRDFDKVDVQAKLRSSDDIIRLLLVCDALKNARVRTLTLPYIPYGRQDRQNFKGEPLSLRVMANLINSIGAERVLTLDPHSDVTPAIINNVEVNTFTPLESQAGGGNYDKIVCPDAGARKRTEKFCVKSGIDPANIIYCDKHRDPATGRLSDFVIQNGTDLKGKRCLIVDDLTDGGFTHIMIANKLKSELGAGAVDLGVSHAIFSKGLEPFEQSAIDAIYTTDSWCDIEIAEKHKIVGIFPCELFMEI